MPLEHYYTIKAGTTSKLLLFFAADAVNPATGKRGLGQHTPGATAAYMREGATGPREIALVAGKLGQWSSGGLTEVDATLMPGVYQFAAPDEMLALGSTRALLLFQFPGARIAPIEISLVAYDPQDSERIGVRSLANDKRHEFLRRAMPRLSEMDLALGEEAERALKENLATRKER